MSYDWNSLSRVDPREGEFEGDGERKPLAPIGLNNFTIRSAEGKRGKESGLPYINVCMRMGDGEYADVYAILPLPDDARKSNAFLEKQLVAFCDVIGVPRDGIGAMIRNLDSIEFKTGKVVLGKDEYDNPNTGRVVEKRKPNWVKSVNAAANAMAAEVRNAPQAPAGEGDKWAGVDDVNDVAQRLGEGVKEDDPLPF